MLGLGNPRRHVRMRAACRADKLPQAERGHFDNPHPASQRLTHALHQTVRLRPGEHNATLLVGLVDNPFHGGKQLGHPLDFVDDQREFMRVEEQHGILFGQQIVARIFHRDVAEGAPKVFFEHRGLTYLARTGDKNHLALCQHGVDGRLNFAPDIHELPPSA